MDFFAVILFVVLYHLRPHEWIGAVATLRPAMLSMLVGLYGTVTRSKGFSVSLLFKTPHDFLMLAYLLWIVGSSPDSAYSTWKACYSLFLYYFVIVLALSSLERIRVFMRWWAFMLVVVASLALASLAGFDPMHSQELTQGVMKGRLVLNTSIFDNPNALGHSLVPALGMLYFLFFWGRFFTFRFMVFPLWGLLGWCLYETESKGSFLSAFATILAAVTFRRPIFVKIVIFVAAATVGWAVVQSLPRMSELEKPRAEGGIQGRLMVFTWGRETYQRRFQGVGWGHFAEGFNEAHHFFKAPHSSYVAIGGELGKPGLFLFVALLYCGYKTLVLAKTRDDEEERVRRMLFTLLLSFTVSSWMVGWESRANFFMMMAAIAAFHRYLLRLEEEPAVDKVKAKQPAGVQPGQPAGLSAPATAVAIQNTSEQVLPATGQNEAPAAGAAAANLEPGITWQRIGLLDILLMLAANYGVYRFWGYILNNM